MNKNEMLVMRLDGNSYQEIAKEAGISRQRVQQVLAPPKAIRDEVIRRYNGRCANCGIRVGRGGHVHHQNNADIDSYNDLTNLELLCLGCHSQKHWESWTRVSHLRVTDKEVLDAITKYRRDNGYCPAIVEMAEVLDRGSSTIYARLHRLRREGRVDWQAGKVRTLRVLKGIE